MSSARISQNTSCHAFDIASKKSSNVGGIFDDALSKALQDVFCNIPALDMPLHTENQQKKKYFGVKVI